MTVLGQVQIDNSIDVIISRIDSIGDNKNVRAWEDLGELRQQVEHEVELLGCLRDEKGIASLSKLASFFRVWSLSKGFRDGVAAGALARIANYDCIIEPLDVERNFDYMGREFPLFTLYRTLMPLDSIIAIIEDYTVARENTMSEKKKKLFII
ncbi:MAG: hypothetical protein LBC74_07040 [Planctomycetaceae bacterium]|nr:hypothetical protein [Planctomycetaceae bacterium]